MCERSDDKRLPKTYSLFQRKKTSERRSRLSPPPILPRVPGLQGDSHGGEENYYAGR